MLLIFIVESHLSAMHLNFVYAQEQVAIKFILVKKQLSSGNLFSIFFTVSSFSYIFCLSVQQTASSFSYSLSFLLLHIDGKDRFQKKNQVSDSPNGNQKWNHLSISKIWKWTPCMRTFFQGNMSNHSNQIDCKNIPTNEIKFLFGPDIEI